jgi:hypothetical protein
MSRIVAKTCAMDGSFRKSWEWIAVRTKLLASRFLDGLPRLSLLRVQFGNEVADISDSSSRVVLPAVGNLLFHSGIAEFQVVFELVGTLMPAVGIPSFSMMKYSP